MNSKEAYNAATNILNRIFTPADSGIQTILTKKPTSETPPPEEPPISFSLPMTDEEIAKQKAEGFNRLYESIQKSQTLQGEIIRKKIEENQDFSVADILMPSSELLMGPLNAYIKAYPATVSPEVIDEQLQRVIPQPLWGGH